MELSKLEANALYATKKYNMRLQHGDKNLKATDHLGIRSVGVASFHRKHADSLVMKGLAQWSSNRLVVTPRGLDLYNTLYPKDLERQRQLEAEWKKLTGE